MTGSSPQAMIVGASCTAELIQDDPAGLSQTMGLPCPVIPLELPSYQRKENWGAAETFYQIVRHLADKDARPAHRAKAAARVANLLGPTALGFRHRDDIVEISKTARRPGHRRQCRRPDGLQPRPTSPGSARPISTSSSIPKSPIRRRAGSKRPSASSTRTDRPHRRRRHPRLHRRGRRHRQVDPTPAARRT